MPPEVEHGSQDQKLACSKWFLGACKPRLAKRDGGQNQGQEQPANEGLKILAELLAHADQPHRCTTGTATRISEITEQLVNQYHSTERYRVRTTIMTLMASVAVALNKAVDDLKPLDFCCKEGVGQLRRVLERRGKRQRAPLRYFYREILDSAGVSILDPLRARVLSLVNAPVTRHRKAKRDSPEHELVHAYLVFLHVEGRPETSIKQTCLAGNRFLRWYALHQMAPISILSLDLTQLSVDDIEDYRANLLSQMGQEEDPLSQVRCGKQGMKKRSSVNTHIRVVRGFLQYLFISKETNFDLSYCLDYIEDSNRSKGWDRKLSPDQCEALLNCILELSDNPLRDVAFIGAMSLGAGCRPCEALNLHVGDCISITGALYAYVSGKGTCLC